MNSSYVTVGHERGYDDFELRDLSKASVSFERDDNNDAEFDYDDPLGRQADLSDDGSLETFQLYTPDEERQVRRKLDRRVILLVTLLYLLSFLDRSNIGNAVVAGMDRDLRLSDAQFEWLLTAFYITYIAFEWMIMLYDMLRPHVYVSLCVLSWGLIASLQAVVTNFPSLLALRALLGVGEAAFGPGVPFYLSFFYRREELALRTGFQLSAAPLASSFAGSLAYLITWLGRDGYLAPWRLLFLVEGFPSICAAVLVWYSLPDSPETASFLNDREKRIAKTRLEERHGSKRRRLDHEHPLGSRDHHLHLREVGQTLLDPKCYLTALMFLNCNIAFSSMPVFLPTVIREMGYSAVSSQALSAPPYLFAFVVLLLTARASDKLASRSPFVMFHALSGFVGYSLIAVGGHYQWPGWARYAAIYPACAGFFSAVTIIITWTINNQESNAKKGTGMTILNVIGQIGPIVGTRLYPDQDRPFYVRGMSVCAMAMLLVFVFAGLLRLVLRRENARNEGANRVRGGYQFVLML